MKLSVDKLGWLLICALSTVGCSESNTPTAPGTTPGPTSQTCRNIVTGSTTTITSGGNPLATQTLSGYSYNTSTNVLTGTITYGTGGGACSAASVTTWGSVANFVDEVSVIPPRMLTSGSTLTPIGASCQAINPVVILTYSYDSQRRLTQWSGNGVTYTYSAWDNAGRFLTGFITGSAFPTSEAWSYNDAQRTSTLVQSSSALTTTTVYSFDANGNPSGYTVTARGVVTAGATTTTGTQQVCK